MTTPVPLQTEPGTPRLAKLVAALVLAGVAAISMHLYARSVREEYRVDEAQVEVVVSRIQLPRGTELQEKHLRIRRVPESAAPKDAVPATRMSEALGKKLEFETLADDYLLWTFLEGTADLGDPLPDRIGAGNRGVAIPVDERSGVGGLLLPGDRVDVLLTYSDPSRGELATKTLLQQVEIIAVGDPGAWAAPRTRMKRSYRSVLAVASQQDSELLALSPKLGSLSLTLRDPSDLAVVEEKEAVSVSEILGEVPEPEPRRQRRKPKPPPPPKDDGFDK